MIPKSKILILSAYSENIPWNNYGKNDYAKVSMEVNRRYAERHGYSFKCIEYKDDEMMPGFGPTWLKIDVILKYLSLYDYVFWIDADAIIVKDIEIESFFGKDVAMTKCTVGSSDLICFTTTSTGIMLIKNSEFSINVFNSLIKESKRWQNGDFRKGPWHEQELLDKMYVEPQVVGTYRFDDDYYNLINRSVSDIDMIFETENFKIYPYGYQNIYPDETSFVFHATGDTPTKKERLEIAIKYYGVNISKVLNEIDFKQNNSVDEFLEDSYRDNEVVEKKFHKDDRVFISFDSKSLGDTIAWMPYVEEFRNKYNCKVILATFWNYLFEQEYREIEFVKSGTIVHNIHGQYNIGWYFPWDSNKNPNDFRIIPLQQTATDILGLEYREIKPKIIIPDKLRTIKEKYVCIGIHSTCQSKYWNYPYGWQKVTDYLNKEGYKVVHISKERGTYMGNISPKNIIDKTGDYPIENRIVDLKHAEMFIGTGSGLSWLSWAIGTPTVLISGFSAPFCEPQKGIERVFNSDVCNSCFNDSSLQFDPGDWDWCPRDKDFECSKAINPEMVINKIDKIIRGKYE